ncbi:MAG: LAGLIDADG family homing endonuclease [Candidatus Magasanikbacteria bacterium]
MPEIILPSLDYIAGIIETSGSFYFSKNNNYTIPVFQVKLIGKQKALLEQIASKLGLNETVHEYLHSGRHYTVLTVRKRSTIERAIIPTFDNRLIGWKKTQFNTWRDQFYRQNLSKLVNVSRQTIAVSPLEIVPPQLDPARGEKN